MHLAPGTIFSITLVYNPVWSMLDRFQALSLLPHSSYITTFSGHIEFEPSSEYNRLQFSIWLSKPIWSKRLNCCKKMREENANQGRRGSHWGGCDSGGRAEASSNQMVAGSIHRLPMVAKNPRARYWTPNPECKNVCVHGYWGFKTRSNIKTTGRWCE